MNYGNWFWLHSALMVFCLAWSALNFLVGEVPPPFLILSGILQALIVHREWLKASKAENKDDPQ